MRTSPAGDRLWIACAKWILCALSVMWVFQGCARNPEPQASPAVQQIDSLLLMRHAGHWEGRLPRDDDRIYRYSVVVARSGDVRFEPFRHEDRGARSFAIEPDSVEVLFDIASRLDLSGLPVSLVGRDPWCNVIQSDAPGVTVASYRGDERHEVSDYHGCSVQRDASEQQLIAKLRQLQRDATRLLRLQSRFDAAPFIALKR